jgi:hypothetical protein
MLSKFQTIFKRTRTYTKKILYEQNDIKITAEDQVNEFPPQVYDLLSSVTWVLFSTLTTNRVQKVDFNSNSAKAFFLN